jgi:hypothetical protein
MNDTNETFFSHMRQVHMDFHMPEFPLNAINNFDAKSFVDHLERGRINMVALFSKCHFGNSFYTTVAGHKHAGLEQDFLMETASECRRRGIFTYAYYSLCTDVRAYIEHENWRYRDREGKDSGIRGPWARLCLNTPYKEELVLPQLEEIIKDYPVDALWLDIPLAHNSDGCFCESCRAKYRGLYGREMIDSITPQEGVTWNFDATINLIREIRHLNEVHGKDILICSNRSGHLNTPLSFSEANDILCWESQPRSNYLSHSFSARYVRTLDRPCQVMSVRFYQGWGDLTLKPAAQMTTEFAAMIGNGVSAVSGDQVNVDGSLTPAVYEMFDQAFGFVQEREQILRGAQSVKEAAVLAPVLSHDAVPVHAEGDPIHGAHKMMVESHFQHDIVNGIQLDKLDEYSVVILPEPCEYDPSVWEILRGWVKAGGTLIACGTATVAEGRFNLEDVFGVEYIEPSVFSVSHFKPRLEVRGTTDDLVLQCRAATQKIVPRGATILADYYFPQGESTDTRAFRNHLAAPPADKPSPYPFAVMNSFGKGTAVYIAGSIFQAYWSYNHHWLRQFFDAVYSHAVSRPAFVVDVPSTVEANLMRTRGDAADGDLLLNLIDYQVGHQASADAIPSIERVVPFHNAKCRVRAEGVADVVLEPEGTAIDFSSKDGYVEFTVPEFTYMAMVRLRG